MQALPLSVQPGNPQFAPHASNAAAATGAAILRLLVARSWPDLTLLFAGRGGDVRCEHGQTGQWRTMPHQTTRSGIRGRAGPTPWFVRARAMHGRHVHLPTLRCPRSDGTALLSALDRHFRDTVAVPRSECRT